MEKTITIDGHTFKQDDSITCYINSTFISDAKIGFDPTLNGIYIFQNNIHGVTPKNISFMGYSCCWSCVQDGDRLTDGVSNIRSRDISIVAIAKDYAIRVDTKTNHLYNGMPYRVHLEQVISIAEKFIHLIPENKRNVVYSSCWLHDVIEDCRQTYNDVKEVVGEEVAELVYAMTNEKGKNRKERGNDKYYQGLRDIKYGSFVKLCDRIANVEFSKQSGSRMLEMYKNENNEFVNKLWVPGYDEMFQYLNNIFTK